MKRLIALLMSLCLILNLAACGKSDSNNQTDDSTKTAASQTTETEAASETETASETNSFKTEQDTSLIIAIGNEYVPYMTEIIKKFENETGIKIEIQERETRETVETLQLDGAAGIGPDITLVAYNAIGQLGSQGTIAEIELPTDNRFYEHNIAQVMYDGKIYGAPAIVESIIMYYNKDLLSNPPATFAELEDLAADDPVVFLAPWNAPYIVYGLLAAYGGYVFGDNGTNPQDIGLNNTGSNEAVSYAKTWFDRWPTGMLDAQSNHMLYMESFFTGKTAAIIAGPWDAASIIETGMNYGVSKIPVLPNGSEYKPFAGGKCWVISNFSTEKEAALSFIDFLTNQESQQLLYDMKNEVPANTDVHQQIQKGDDELVKAVIAQYEFAMPTPNIPEMSEYWSLVENMLFDAYKGDMPVQEALDAGVSTYREIIEQKY